MTSSCFLGVLHAMFAKTAGNEIEAIGIGSWDEVKWAAASGWERGRAHNLIALHLSLEVPPVELEVTGKVQEIFCLRQFLGSWWDEMLLYLLLRPPLSADLEIMTRLTTSPLCSSTPPLLLCSLVSLFLRQQRRIIHHYKQLLRSRSGPSPNPTSALKILNIIEYTGFVHICQVWFLFELRLSVNGSLDEFVALKVNFGVLCGERNILNYFL